MATTKNQPRVAKQESAPATPPQTAQASVIAERRKFPRELPKPDVVELNSDSAWQAFQASFSAGKEAPPRENSDTSEQ